MELVVPERLNETEMLGFLEDGFAIAHAVMPGGRPFDEVARAAGYRRAMAENMTPFLRLDSYVHGHNEQRLILHTHRYAGFTRRVLHLMLPGGVAVRNLEAFRERHVIAGATYDWRGHLYGEWHFGGDERENDLVPAEIFVEVSQDVLQGEPVLLRTIFHHVARADG
jgi:hypothetical protein